ncbi:MAG: hypothetical protein ACTSWD_04730 [Candidatus Heimdallarchaeota archaeon]
MPITNGQTPDADEVLRVIKVSEVYTGSGFNSGAYELTAVPSDDLVNANYVTIKITWTGQSATGGSSVGNAVTILPEIKETGDSYGNIVSTQTLFQITGGPTSNTIKSGGTVEFHGTITAGMRTNGFQIRLTGSSITNIQTIVEVKA